MPTSLKLILFSIFFILLVLPLGAQDWKDRQNWPDDFPRPPRAENSLFFIQRNKNTNTVVYDLRKGKDHQVNSRNPIDVYWLRYGDKGERAELSWLQEVFAYGYRSRKNKEEGGFNIKLKAYGERTIHLKQVEGIWKPILQINDRNCVLENIYVYADESRLFPDVIHVDIYGTELSTGRPQFERIFND